GIVKGRGDRRRICVDGDDGEPGRGQAGSPKTLSHPRLIACGPYRVDWIVRKAESVRRGGGQQGPTVIHRDHPGQRMSTAILDDSCCRPLDVVKVEPQV